jgi:hypothetical protein
MFCEAVQHCLRFCLDHLGCVKMAAFQLGKQRKVAKDQVRRVEWLGGDSLVVLGQKFPGEKGSGRRCVVMMQQPFLLSLKFEAKYSQIFTQLL